MQLSTGVCFPCLALLGICCCLFRVVTACVFTVANLHHTPTFVIYVNMCFFLLVFALCFSPFLDMMMLGGFSCCLGPGGKDFPPHFAKEAAPSVSQTMN